MIKTLFIVLSVFAFLWVPIGRTAEPASVSGKWHFVFDTPGGDRASDSIFEQSAEKVTGKWAIDAKQEGAAVAGTFIDKDLALEFPYDSPEGGAGTMTIKGHLGDDGALTGEWGFTGYSGAFKATRVKEATAK